jgi:adenine-specific DNA-methyltransferase
MSAQAQLFSEDLTFESPSTEGIKYAGSKLKLIPQILRLARKVNAKTVLDGFSGTTRVSQAFAQRGYDVVCNDHAVWSEVFGTCYLKGKAPREYRGLIEHLNAVAPRDGWFTEFYGGDSNEKHQPKRPWQVQNTRKLDAIREEIERLSLDPVEKCVALTSLILALDQVDSTLGHFVSYLREWSPRSYKTLQLRVPAIVGGDRSHAHHVHRADIFDAVASNGEVDIAYYDPPYGSNNEKMPPSRVRYASYYHVWTTICLYDRPVLFGRVNRRADTSDTVANSPFEDFRRDADGKFIAVEAIRKLLASTRAPYIILSYSSGGRATSEELNQAIESCGRLLEVVEVDYKRNVMADMKWTNEWLRDAEAPNREFLFLIKKDPSS